MYNNKMVCSLKANDKIVREKGDEIYLPFGSEYSLYLKNLESRKAKVKISIDGEDVLNGSSLLINPNDTCELEGFLKDKTAKNKFKFIEKTQEISEFRGDKLEDGIIRIEFTYEKIKPVINNSYWMNDYRYGSETIPLMRTPYNLNHDITYCNNVTCSLDGMNISSAISKGINVQASCNNINNLNSLRSMETSSITTLVNDLGITVKGTEINQEFKNGSIGELEEQSHAIILRLKGYKEENKQVDKVVAVKDKIQCKTCGRMSKSDCKYCSNCGTYLE